MAARRPKVPGARAIGPYLHPLAGVMVAKWRYRHQSDGVLPALAGTERDRQEEQALRWLASGLAA